MIYVRRDYDLTISLNNRKNSIFFFYTNRYILSLEKDIVSADYFCLLSSTKKIDNRKRRKDDERRHIKKKRMILKKKRKTLFMPGVKNSPTTPAFVFYFSLLRGLIIVFGR